MTVLSEDVNNTARIEVLRSQETTVEPARQIIKEMEEGTVHYQTRIIEDCEEIIKELGRLFANSNELDTCLTSGGMQYSYNHFFEIQKNYCKAKRGRAQWYKMYK